MTRDEEVALKLHLEHILRQVQYSVKAMGLQPVELCDIDIVRPFPSRRGAITGAYPSLFKRSGSEVSRLPRRSLEAELGNAGGRWFAIHEGAIAHDEYV